MSEEKRNIPNLRFPGFTDAWEQRKVGDIARKTFGGGTPKTSIEEYWNGNIPWIQSSNITEHELFNADIQKHITDIGLQKSATQLVPSNSIAVVSHVGVGKLVFMPFEYTTSQDFISLSDIDADPIFICYALYKRLQENLHIVQGSAIKGITKDTLLNKEISTPNITEQKKIGNCFRNIDNLITLHQRKCDEIKNLKKCMLQKMFPKEGEQIPEIRFPGFTDAWEQRKLSDLIVDLKSGLSRELDSKDIGLPVIRANNINDNHLDLTNDIKYWYVDDPQGADTKNYLVKKNDLLINFINSEAKMGTAAIVENTPSRDTIYTTNILRMRLSNIVNPHFFLAQTNLKNYKQFIKSITKPAVNQASFTTVDYKKYEFLIPNREEQNKIASLILELDNLITLHQRKLEQLKEMKKSLLQQMFV